MEREAPRGEKRGLYGRHPSKSADAARRKEFAEIAAMTPRERILQMGDDDRSLDAATRVYAVLEAKGVPAAVIGGKALAVHRYPRHTDDIDLATFIEPYQSLPAIHRALRAAGFEAELFDPDADDELGGVIDVTGDFGRVQIVNFLNPMGRRRQSGLVDEAIREAPGGLVAGTTLRVVTLRHLIALKLKAGSAKDKGDVIELLERNAPLDLAPIRDVCGRFDLGPALEKVLDELGADRLEGRV